MLRDFKPMFICPVLLFFSAATIANGSIPLPTPQEQEQVIWTSAEDEIHLPSPVFENQIYFSLDQLARVTRAATGTDKIKDEMCLVRDGRSLCFSPLLKLARLSSPRSQTRVNTRFEKGVFYVPAAFVTSSPFQLFTHTTIRWDPKRREVKQEQTPSLSIPPVENLGDRYRLTLDVDHHTTYELLEKGPKRVWLRFFNARTEGSAVLEGDRVVRSVEIAQRRRSADVTVELGPEAESAEVWSDSAQRKLYIDIFIRPEKPDAVPVPKAPKMVASAAELKSVPLRKPARMTPSKPLARAPLPKGSRVVVIDPGHGGIDCGAIGVTGTMEKDVNLKVALAVAELLRKEPNVTVLLTRDKDTFVALKDRADLANKAKATMFVSIHCNSSLSPSNAGFETYVLSSNASDDSAAAVARVENAVLALESNKGDKPDKLMTLLASLAMTDFMNESSKLASYICRNVKERSTVKSAAVREANFYVLRGTEMPAVLVELEYLSNPSTEAKLSSRRFQGQLTRGIVDGILYYERSARLREQKKQYDAKAEGVPRSQ